MRKVDFLIVGQGIAGSLLALALQERGKSVLVLDEEITNTSSNKAGGLYNPITGRKMVKTWLADELFPSLEAFYRGLEAKLGGHFLHPRRIYRPFLSVEEQNDWAGRAATPQYQHLIASLQSTSLGIKGIRDPFGGLELNHSGFVDLPELIRLTRSFLVKKGSYEAGVFQYPEMQLQGEQVVYKDISAEVLIFCEGPKAADNPYWSALPFRLVKGEIIDIKADLPDDRIINRGVFVVPVNGYFRVGSTYDHQHPDYQPTEAGVKSLEERLSGIYSGPYEVLRTSAGVRPATFDRRPFIGSHKKHRQIGIFNGFGTKGVSLVPYFANQMVNYLLEKGTLDSKTDVNRIF